MKKKPQSPGAQDRILKADWDEELFAERNQAYGAYSLRKGENLRLANAFMFVLTILGMIGLFLKQIFLPVESEEDHYEDVIMGAITLDYPLPDEMEDGFPEEERGVVSVSNLEDWEEFYPAPEPKGFCFGPLNLVSEQWKLMNVNLSIESVHFKANPYAETAKWAWSQEVNLRSFLRGLPLPEHAGPLNTRSGFMKVLVRVDAEGEYQSHLMGLFQADHEFREACFSHLPCFRVKPPEGAADFTGADLFLELSYENAEAEWPCRQSGLE